MSSPIPSPVIEEASKRWKRCADAEDKQRSAILLAKQFRALDQWPAAIKSAREGAGTLAGQPPQPPRPCLVVDRLTQPARAISNTIKNADFGFDVMPNGGGADKDTAEILKGYMRRVQNQSRGESPIEWAADGAIEGGLGWFRLKTEFVHAAWEGDPGDPEAYDQELVLKRIPNNLSVYCDPSANLPTRRDAQFMFVVEDMDKDEFKRRFPNADARGLENFQSTGDMAAWVSKDIIRVAEYWRVEYDERKLWASKDGQSGEGDPPKGADVLYRRTVRKPRIVGSLINAIEELETFKWTGLRIPIFPILGEELNIDGKALLRGIIALGMDAQRMVNYTYSGAVEIFSLASKNAPRVPAESIARYKPIWDTRNVYNYSYLPYDQWDEQGREMRPPVDDTSEPPIQAAVALMRISEDAIKASTSTGDASLGNTNPNERSGRALEALQAQSDLANSNYADHVRRALIDCAEEMAYVIPKITRPGQIVHILGMDDKPEQVMVGQPFQRNAQGIPEAAPQGITPDIARQPDNLWKFYDPTRGRYAVTVTIGKASATRQQEGSKALGELIPHLPPEMAAAVTPDYVKQLSFPGAQGIAEKLEKTLPPHLQSNAQDGQQAIPPEVQAQMQQMQQALQEAQQAIQTDQAKQQASIEQAHIKAATDLEIAKMDNATKIEVARISAAKQAADPAAEAAEERLATGLEQAHDVGMAAMQQAHEREMAERGQAHESAEAASGREATAEQAEAARAHEADMAAQAAQQQSEAGA